MSIVLKNNASSFIVADITSSQTGITLESGASFPTLGAGEYFYGTLEGISGNVEIVKVTARSGNALTVVRGQDGSIPSGFAAGSRFEARINAASVEEKAQQIAEAEVQELRDDLSADDGSSLVGFKQTGSSAVARTTEKKLQDFVSVKDFGAVGDGVADDTAAFNLALASADKVYVPSGRYNVDGVVVPGNGKTLMGENYRTTIINVTTASPSYGINLNGSSEFTAQDLRFTGSGRNLIRTGGSAFYARFERCWFIQCQEAFTVQGAMYWAVFSNCIWRDATRGLIAASAQTMNAVTFSGCTFWHSAPASAEDCIQISNSDGIVFQGCQAQNVGVNLSGCANVVISGGYWECFTRSAITAANSSITLTGPHFSPGNRFTFDSSSASRLRGDVPKLIASPATVIYSGSALCHSQSHLVNVFPDATCSTSVAAASINFSPTGLAGSASINGDGNLEISMSGLARNGFLLTGVPQASVYARFRLISGTGKIEVNGTPNNLFLTSSDEFVEYRSNGGDGSQFFVLFSPESASCVIEVTDLVVCPGNVYIPGSSTVTKSAVLPDGVRTGSVTAGNISATGITLPRGVFSQIEGSVVSVPDSSATTVLTFTGFGTNGPGFWFVTVTRDAFGFVDSTQPFWSGIVAVGQNNTLTISPLAANVSTASASGLNLQITHTHGSARDLLAKAIKLGAG